MGWQFDTGCSQPSPKKAGIIGTINLALCQFPDSWRIHVCLPSFIPATLKPFYTSVNPFQQPLAPAEPQFAPCVVDMWVSSSDCEVTDAVAGMPSPALCPHVGFPQGACLLVEPVLHRPLGSAVWCNSPAGEISGAWPWALSSPLFPICSQTRVTDGSASSCGFTSERGAASLKVTGRSSSTVPCRMSLPTHRGLFNTRAPLFVSFATCSEMGF